MGLFKPGRKKQSAFEIQLAPTRREKIAARRADAADRAIAILAREKKKQAERDALVEKAEAMKAAALARREEKAEAARKKDAARQQRSAEQTACTCRKPTVGRDGKCRRCHMFPAGKRRR